jgi:hypothetical protein
LIQTTWVQYIYTLYTVLILYIHACNVHIINTVYMYTYCMYTILYKYYTQHTYIYTIPVLLQQFDFDNEGSLYSLLSPQLVIYSYCSHVRSTVPVTCNIITRHGTPNVYST